MARTAEHLTDLVSIDLNGCWEWMGSRYGTRGGYGQSPSWASSRSAHRAMYEMYVGPIPDGMYVCHRCDNPPCVRPDHLYAGTQADNLADMRAKDRGNRGVRNGMARLTEDDVRQVRTLVDSGMAQAEVARRTGYTPQQVSRIVLRQRWEWVE